MSIDFNKPITTDEFADILSNIVDNYQSLASMDYTGASNIPTGAIRWNSTDNIFQKYNGTTWDTLFDYVSIQNAIADYFNYGLTTNSGNTYSVSLPTAPSSYTTGMRLKLKINTVNTGSATINVNSLGAKTVKCLNGATLIGGELNGFVELVYDGTDLILISFEPAWTAWTPTFASPNSRLSGMTVTGGFANFKHYGDYLKFHIYGLSGTISTLAEDYITFTLPKAGASLGSGQVFSSNITQSTLYYLGYSYSVNASSSCRIYGPTRGAGFWTVGSGKAIECQGLIRV